MYLSLYIFISLFNFVSVDRPAGIDMQDGLYSKNGEIWRRKAAEYNTDLALVRKQLSYWILTIRPSF